MSNKRIGGDFNSLFNDNNMEESEGLRFFSAFQPSTSRLFAGSA